MNYKLKCKNCKKEFLFSSHNTIEFLNIDGTVSFEWDCPECKEAVIASSYSSYIKRKNE